MTKYLQSTPFTVNDPIATKEYRDGWDRVFGKKCLVCGEEGINRGEDVVLCIDCETKLEKELENYELALAVGREPNTPFYDQVLALSEKVE